MTEIIPAIMPNTILELESAVARVKGAVSYVQVDVMDGKFVPETNWPFPNCDGKQTTSVPNMSLPRGVSLCGAKCPPLV